MNIICSMRCATSETALRSPQAHSQLIIVATIFCCIAIVAATVQSAQANDHVDPDNVYQVIHAATLDPLSGNAHVNLVLEQPRRLVRSIRFFMPAKRYLNIRPASRVERQGDYVTWRPKKRGSKLQFDFIIDHQRSNGADHARITDTWALLKLDNLFPRASTQAVRGAISESSLILEAPAGWAIETPYGWGAKQTFEVNDPHRRYDQPRGWMIAGEIGVRREKIGERYISIASPLGTDLRANDMLAFLRWTMPSLLEVIPDFPQRLLIVSGPEDMWRGGLSGRASLYLHSNRPMISGNRTSTLLHELFHVASGLSAKDGADWIIEGLAEYYSLTLLLRSDGISKFRYEKSLAALADWSNETDCAATDQSGGKQTARATLVLHALDLEIRAATKGKSSLDTLVEMLTRANQPVTNGDFRAAAEKLIRGPVRALSSCP